MNVRIRGGANEYEAHVGAGLLDRAGILIRRVVDRSRCAIISDNAVAPRFAERLSRSLTSSGFEPAILTIPPGEQFKTLEQAGVICDEMMAAGLDRQSFVVGLGGGVIGDISGFVAAIFQRGIPHVQIPTTLLAMVDSSIGGKTGVNTRVGKNLIGAVHHPALVIDDVDLLETLPRRQFRQGFAEIIKHGIIADADMFEHLNPDQAMDAAALPELIRRNIEIKASVVARDEFDRSGDRAVLNFGHTVGHAIERAGHYGDLLHGEAISLGMVAAAQVSVKRAGLSRDECGAIIDRLAQFELPTRLPPEFSREKIVDALRFDKKFESGEVRFVVAPKIGSAHLSKDVTLDDLREAIETL